MLTDKVFHQLFTEFPEFLFELMGKEDEVSFYMPYRSEEVKEKSFRLDAVLEPKDDKHPLIFVEIQMRNDPDFYYRITTEAMLYLSQKKWKGDWQIVVLFGTKKAAPKQELVHKIFFDSQKITLYHLPHFLKEHPRQTLGLDVLRLIIASQKQAIPLAKALIARTWHSNATPLEQKLVEHISSVIAYKFSNLSPEQIEAMLELDRNFKKSVFYKAATAEAKAEVTRTFAQNLIHFLSDRFGAIPKPLENAILEADAETLNAYYFKAWNIHSLDELSDI